MKIVLYHTYVQEINNTKVCNNFTKLCHILHKCLLLATQNAYTKYLTHIIINKKTKLDSIALIFISPIIFILHHL